MSSYATFVPGLVALALSASALASPRVAEREIRKTLPLKDGSVLEIENLAGIVRLEAAPGAQVEIVAELHAEGKDEAETKELLALLDVAFETSGERVRVRGQYPLDRYDKIHYPRPDARDDDTPRFLDSLLSISSSHVRYQGHRVMVVTGRRRNAPTLYVDLRVRVPAGVGVDVRNSIGVVAGGDVRGPLAVDSDSGDVRLHAVKGTLRVHTGSGDVLLREIEGAATVDTGSGDVRFEGARGDTSLRTGSGDVTLKRSRGDVTLKTGSGDAVLRDVEAKRVTATTGSGNVTLERVSGSLEIHTGSGDIRGDGLSAAERLSAHTGSGNVVVQGDLTGAREVKLSTSSGDVDLSLARAVPMSLRATTSTGEISVELADVRTVKKSDHVLVAEVAGGGASVEIETSSGNVRIAGK